jgi:hypothetical protein
MERVFVNLVNNAIEAMPHGGGIEIDAERNGKSVVVRVRDNGPGIPAEIRDRLFQPFVTSGKNGLGLGLGAVATGGDDSRWRSLGGGLGGGRGVFLRSLAAGFERNMRWLGPAESDIREGTKICALEAGVEVSTGNGCSTDSAGRGSAAPDYADCAVSLRRVTSRPSWLRCARARAEGCLSSSPRRRFCGSR